MEEVTIHIPLAVVIPWRGFRCFTLRLLDA